MRATYHLPAQMAVMFLVSSGLPIGRVFTRLKQNNAPRQSGISKKRYKGLDQPILATWDIRSKNGHFLLLDNAFPLASNSMERQGGVLPLVVVDNSAFFPGRLTAVLTLPMLASQGSSPSFPFQTARILVQPLSVVDNSHISPTRLTARPTLLIFA